MTACLRLRLLKERGLRSLKLSEEMALVSGNLLLKHRNVLIADALIASPVKLGQADYVVADDSHYKTFGARTRWL